MSDDTNSLGADTTEVQGFCERLRPDHKHVRVPTREDTAEVLVVGPSYHDPDQMTVGADGEHCPESVAFHEREAVPCSACFDDQHGIGYAWPYLDPETYLTDSA